MLQNCFNKLQANQSWEKNDMKRDLGYLPSPIVDRQWLRRKWEQLPVCLPWCSCPIYRGYVGVYMTGQVLSPFSTVQEADQPLPISKNQSSTFERSILFVLCRLTSLKIFSFSAIYLIITPKHAISRRGKP